MNVELRAYVEYKYKGKKRVRAFVLGTVVADGDRFNVVNDAGNLLVLGATSAMMAALRDRQYLKDL